MDETPKGRKRLSPEKWANRVKWVGALLSGDYTQGNGKLHITSDGRDEWCCLGVAGDVIGLDRALVDRKGMLPREWAETNLGLTGSSVFGAADSDQSTAAGWNDSRRLSFEAIADRVALATERHINLHDELLDNPVELTGQTVGAYASEWLARQETPDE